MSETWNTLWEQQKLWMKYMVQKDWNESIYGASRATHEASVRWRDEVLSAWNAHAGTTTPAYSPGSQAGRLAMLDAAAAGSLLSKRSSQSEASVASASKVREALRSQGLWDLEEDLTELSLQWTPTSMDSLEAKSFRATRTPCLLAVKRLWPSSPSPQG